MAKKLNEAILRNNMALLEKLVLYKLDELYPEIEGIRKNYSIPYKETVIPYRDPENYASQCEKAEKETSAFFEENSELIIFFQKINSVRKKTGLGKEWNSVFSRFAISGILLPPPFSIFVYEDEENETITFETNKNTTPEDLIFAWEYYKEAREKMFGKSRSHYSSQSNAATVALIKQLEATKKKEGLTDEEVAAYITPEEELLDDAALGKADKRAGDWLKKNRERFKREVTD